MAVVCARRPQCALVGGLELEAMCGTGTGFPKTPRPPRRERASRMYAIGCALQNVRVEGIAHIKVQARREVGSPRDIGMSLEGRKGSGGGRDARRKE